MANIFFGYSIRGGYEKVSQKELSRIPEIIEELGHANTLKAPDTGKHIETGKMISPKRKSSSATTNGFARQTQEYLKLRTRAPAQGLKSPTFQA